ncbi:MAG: YabP/YqfC family sporulation protein [Ruminococcus sp.]|nr:YabP/YqfC family sporulation protein [Ruminococcus sp.]
MNVNDRPCGKHQIIMNDCLNIVITGVTDADSFDEHCIKVFTECGELTIYGEGLHVNEMNVETGSLSVEGSLTALIYGDRRITRRLGLLGKLMR